MPYRARLLLAVLLPALAGCDTLTLPPPGEPPATRPWSEMIDAVNAARARGATCGGERLPPAGPLAWSGRLEQAALRHSADMARHDRFSHVGTDGTEVGDRARLVGYSYRRIGENIARYQKSVGEVVEDWLESPSHCRQLLDPRFVEMGAAEKDQYWTQVLGVPR